MEPRTILLALFGTLCASVSFAGDWYVDANAGHDGNGGQSEADAWRTLTHAVSAIGAFPGVEHTLHVAPGTYDPGHGETFPLYPPPLLRVRGTGGSAFTHLAGSGPSSPTLLVYSGDRDERSGASGLTLRDATRGVNVFGGGLASRPRFDDLVIRDMSQYGIYVSATFSMPGLYPFVHATFESLEILECQVGIVVRANAPYLGGASARASVLQSAIRDCVSDGGQLIASGIAGARLELDRVEVLRNGGFGISASSSPGTTVATLEARSSLFALNQQGGLDGVTGGSSYGTFNLTDCTVAHNGPRGLRCGFFFDATLINSIVAGHSIDIQYDNEIYGAYSNSPGGELLHLPQSLALDPLFRDPAGGDFRLAWGSPCIDVGQPAAEPRADLVGHARSVDGDLDAAITPDMGALEFLTLELLGTPHIGGSLAGRSWGEAGSAVSLLLAHWPLVDPVATPFGRLEIHRGRMHQRFLGAIPVGGPLAWTLAIPPGSYWVGRPISIQTLSTSTTAPHGAALSNPISFIVLP